MYDSIYCRSLHILYGNAFIRIRGWGDRDSQKGKEKVKEMEQKEGEIEIVLDYILLFTAFNCAAVTGLHTWIGKPLTHNFKI